MGKFAGQAGEVRAVYKTERRIFFIALPLILLICLSLWAIKSSVPTVDISSRSGVWDLTRVDFDRDCVQLAGDVEFVADRLLTPEEFAAFPVVEVGEPGDSSHISTSRITLKLPKGDYMLLIRTVDYASRTFVNGSWVGDAGVPAETAEDSTPGVFYLYPTVSATDGVIEIVQQSANHIHINNGYHTGISVGKPTLIRNLFARKTGVNAIIMGLYLAMTITHLVLFMLLRSYRVNLYACLLCLVWVFRTGTTGMRVIAEMFPSLPLTFLLRVEYIALPASCALLSFTLSELFPEVIGGRFRKVMSTLSALFGCVVLFGDTITMTATIYLFYAALFGGIGYVALRFAFKLRSLRPGQGIMLTGLILLSYSIVHEILFYLGYYIFPGDNTIMDFALLLFIFFQTTVVIFLTIQELADIRIRERQLALENEALSRLNRERHAFLGNLSHEMKMPLTVISGYAQYTDELMDDEPPDFAEMHDNMRRVILEAERLERLVSQLMDLTALERGHLKMNIVPIDLVRTFAGIAQSHFAMMNDKNNRIVTDVQPNLPMVMGDKERIVQVGVNLLSNACRHTTNGVITAKAHTEGDFVKISLSDTGEGIDPQLMPLLLNTYPKDHGGKVAGSGLGLYICNQLVAAQGGKIGIESTPGQGTNVWFTLPICTEEGKDANGKG